ncbi:transmembrane protein 18 isoform X2 [Amborella trichopoda]|uniref:transmembrane protein 18 isoform X2 n=1 Tax=Amborella trichopoda TaxID=13333 RepID=UPI0009BFC1E0|nr:transmembrane protein 18 isoform X2 [Amborella trichopoda]|eukprot:XP_020524527.1 transmembrane protein 18 isoform X2 [Amborella trichopoda]
MGITGRREFQLTKARMTSTPVKTVPYFEMVFEEPWLILLLCFHFVLLVTAITFRKKINFQMGLFVMALVGVYLAEKINIILAKNWEMFAGQNYFDPYGLFLSVLWSGPLLFISIIILINTLVSLCQLIVRWKRAELRHRARLARGKQD